MWSFQEVDLFRYKQEIQDNDGEYALLVSDSFYSMIPRLYSSLPSRIRKLIKNRGLPIS